MSNCRTVLDLSSQHPFNSSITLNAANPHTHTHWSIVGIHRFARNRYHASAKALVARNAPRLYRKTAERSFESFEDGESEKKKPTTKKYRYYKLKCSRVSPEVPASTAAGLSVNGYARPKTATVAATSQIQQQVCAQRVRVVSCDEARFDVCFVWSFAFVRFRCTCIVVFFSTDSSS